MYTETVFVVLKQYRHTAK